MSLHGAEISCAAFGLHGVGITFPSSALSPAVAMQRNKRLYKESDFVVSVRPDLGRQQWMVCDWLP